MTAKSQQDTTAIVVGLGMTGVTTARKLAELGARVTAFDNAQTAAVRAAEAELGAFGIETRIGELTASDLAGVDVVVASPGVPPDSPSMAVARAAGVETISEIELASRLCGGTIVAVTGTNGKTTTATLIGELLAAGGRDTVVAGNIAPAFISMLKDDDVDTVYVIEVSSFQLATVSAFRPHVAIMLNITPDHLNWHGTMDEYVAAKQRIFENQTASDFAVLNVDDETVRALSQGLRSQVVGFSMQPLPAGVCVSDGWIVERRGTEEAKILRVEELKMLGAHNVSNALAATAAARACGVGTRDVGRALAAFAGVEHRLEKVGVVNGVTYWNDSKATNPDAATKALEAFDDPIIVLLGGRNKGSSFDEVAHLAVARTKMAITFGEAASEIDDSLARAGAQHRRTSKMADAVALAARTADIGDNVVLSPACASFDEFDNFEHRGWVFKELVSGLEGGAA